MSQLTVAAGFAKGLLDLAVARGAARDALLDQAGIEAADLQDSDGRLPFARYVALMRAGQRLAGDPALALHYGESVDIAQVSIVGLIGQASATMLDAFQQLNRYVALIVETRNVDGGPRFRLTPDRDGLWMSDAREDAQDFPELTESAFAQIVTSPRRLHDAAFVKAVHFTHADRGYREEAERIFGAPVTYSSDRNAVLIDASWAAGAVARLPAYAFGVLTDHADALLATLEASKTTRGRVESLLIPILHTGKTGMDLIADRMAMSRQTLFRRLKREGVTYEQVLDDLRHSMAMRYLAGRKVSVNETAYLVGFSDPAAFSRAFKRWTGASPGSIRVA